VRFSGEHVNVQQRPSVCRLTQDLHLHTQRAGRRRGVLECVNTNGGDGSRPPCQFSRSPSLWWCCRCRCHRVVLSIAVARAHLARSSHPRDTEDAPLRSTRHPRANPTEAGVRRVCSQVRFLGSKTAALTSPTPPAGRRPSLTSSQNLARWTAELDRVAMRCPEPQKPSYKPRSTSQSMPDVC
jgi:hypothetical protein